jgi:hypothetical protein
MTLMYTGLGGASGYGDNSWKTNFGAGADDSSTPLDLTSVFGAGGINFFGTSYTSLNLGTNGILTFNTPENGYAATGVVNRPLFAGG